jgi:hypothetical protein
MVQAALQKSEVKGALLRCHPSENPDWYMKFCDKKFWKISNQSLDDDLKTSTLVIGPSSSVFIEAIISGVNYYIFEPVLNTTYSFDYSPVPPFDGTDPRAPVAKSFGDLERLIKSGRRADPAIVDSYVSRKYDLSGVKKILDR